MTGQAITKTALRGYGLFWLTLLLSVAIFCVDLLLPLGVAAGVPYVLIVLLAQWYTDRRYILASALVASILTIIGYLASPEGGDPWVVLTNRALALFAIWVTALLCYGRKDFEAIIVEGEQRRTLLFDAVRESELNLAEAQHIAHVGSWSMDLLQDSLEWSDEVYSIFGRAPGSFELTNRAVKTFVHPDDWKPLLETIQASMKSFQPFAIDHRIIRPDGETRVVHVIGHITKGKHGEAEQVKGTTQDITDMKRIEEEKTALETQVMHAQKLESLGIMAGGIAHDFNNLLMGILGNADLISTDPTCSPEIRPLAGDIAVSAERAGDLARQMLAYSGKGKVAIDVVDANTLVKEMETLVASAILKNVSVEFNLEENIPPLECDATQIRQIIMNLITNAAEAIGDSEGTITITTGVEKLERDKIDDAHLWKDLSDGDYVYIMVRDTGPGIDDETLSRIFDPFFTTKFTGRGLGLSTVMGIVRGHRGRVQIESKPGEGTFFKVSLPVSEKDIVATAPKSSPSSNWNGQGAILLVDDEDLVRNVTQRMLESLGFSVLSAADGEQAVELFAERHADIVCVILDMSMPGMNGEMTGIAIHRINPDVPAILASGYNEKEVMERVTSDHFADIIQKPYKIAILANKLQSVLETT